jgi:hypothetical protein
MYALKSSEARRQYPRRLKLIFDFIGLGGTLNDQGIEFLKRLKEDINSEQDNVIRFLEFHKERVRAEQVMLPANVEILMGHDIGISESYWRPTEQEVLQDYLKAVPLLSISNTSTKLVLQKQVQELKEKSTGSEMNTRSALKEKDQEIQALKMEMAEMRSMMHTIGEKLEVKVIRSASS